MRNTPARQPSSKLPICHGCARFGEAELQAIAINRGQLAAWSEAWLRHGSAAPNAVRGDFAVAIPTLEGGVFLAVDRFAIHSLCYRINDGQLHVAERADDLAGTDAELDPQALYDYLYLHMIPAPRTVFKDIFRLPAGHYALFENGRLTVAPWWKPHFDENRRAPVGELKSEFRQILLDAVRDRLDGDTTGCFLSGGTDSSTAQRFEHFLSRFPADDRGATSHRKTN